MFWRRLNTTCGPGLAESWQTVTLSSLFRGYISPTLLNVPEVRTISSAHNIYIFFQCQCPGPTPDQENHNLSGWGLDTGIFLKFPQRF